MNATTQEGTKTIEVEYEIAVHDHSGMVLINGRWVMGASIEDEYLYGETNYREYVDIIEEDDERYCEDDCEQEHEDDYYIDTRTIELEYTDQDEADYQDYLMRARGEELLSEENRSHYYGYAMNQGGGKKEFNDVCGRNRSSNIMTFGEYLVSCGA